MAFVAGDIDPPGAVLAIGADGAADPVSIEAARLGAFFMFTESSSFEWRDPFVPSEEVRGCASPSLRPRRCWERERG